MITEKQEIASMKAMLQEPKFKEVYGGDAVHGVTAHTMQSWVEVQNMTHVPYFTPKNRSKMDSPKLNLNRSFINKLDILEAPAEPILPIKYKSFILGNLPDLTQKVTPISQMVRDSYAQLPTFSPPILEERHDPNVSLELVTDGVAKNIFHVIEVRDAGIVRAQLQLNTLDTQVAAEELHHAADYFLRGTALSTDTEIKTNNVLDHVVHGNMAVDAILTQAAYEMGDLDHWHTQSLQQRVLDAPLVPPGIVPWTMMGKHINCRFIYPSSRECVISRVQRMAEGFGEHLHFNDTEYKEFGGIDPSWFARFHYASLAYGLQMPALMMELMEISEGASDAQIADDAVEWGKDLLRHHRATGTESLMVRHHQPLAHIRSPRDIPTPYAMPPAIYDEINPYLQTRLPVLISDKTIAHSHRTADVDSAFPMYELFLRTPSSRAKTEYLWEYSDYSRR